MTKAKTDYPVFELRVALTTADYKRMVRFYCDGLGIEPAQIWHNSQGRAMILDMGKATLEIFDEEQARTIDQIETGKRCSGQVRCQLWGGGCCRAKGCLQAWLHAGCLAQAAAGKASKKIVHCRASSR